MVLNSDDTFRPAQLVLEVEIIGTQIIIPTSNCLQFDTKHDMFRFFYIFSQVVFCTTVRVLIFTMLIRYIRVLSTICCRNLMCSNYFHLQLLVYFRFILLDYLVLTFQEELQQDPTFTTSCFYKCQRIILAMAKFNTNRHETLSSFVLCIHKTGTFKGF